MELHSEGSTRVVHRFFEPPRLVQAAEAAVSVEVVLRDQHAVPNAHALHRGSTQRAVGSALDFDASLSTTCPERVLPPSAAPNERDGVEGEVPNVTMNDLRQTDAFRLEVLCFPDPLDDRRLLFPFMFFEAGGACRRDIGRLEDIAMNTHAHSRTLCDKKSLEHSRRKRAQHIRATRSTGRARERERVRERVEATLSYEAGQDYVL